MLTESYFSSVSGPPIANNTAIAKDVGVYEHTLHPSHSTATSFKKSSVPRHGLAVGETHVFAAQDEKSTVHVYARARGGNQEALVTFPERISCVLLLGDVLFLGTQEGRVIIWEVSLDPLSFLSLRSRSSQLTLILRLRPAPVGRSPRLRAMSRPSPAWRRPLIT